VTERRYLWPVLTGRYPTTTRSYQKIWPLVSPNLRIWYSNLRRRKEPLAATEAAVSIWIGLARISPILPFIEGLAKATRNLGRLLRDNEMPVASQETLQTARALLDEVTS